MNRLKQLRWYWVTRSIGGVTAFYELFIDRSAERGTILLAAFGLLGFDWVAKREHSDDKPARDKRDSDA